MGDTGKGGALPYGSGSSPTGRAASVSPVPASIPNAANWRLEYDDDSERLEVFYDLASTWGTDIAIRQWGSADSTMHIEIGDARWLAARLLDAAIAIEARSDATPKSDAAEGESAAIAQPLPPLSDKEKD